MAKMELLGWCSHLDMLNRLEMLDMLDMLDWRSYLYRGSQLDMGQGSGMLAEVS
jgi:hypothetical protein